MCGQGRVQCCVLKAFDHSDLANSLQHVTKKQPHQGSALLAIAAQLQCAPHILAEASDIDSQPFCVSIDLQLPAKRSMK